MPDPFERAARVAAGIATGDDLAWLRAGFSAWQLGAGDVTLDRCLRLNMPRRGRLAQRDALLDELAGAVVPRAGEGRAAAMLRAIAAFERERWPGWQHLQVAPAGATRAERIMHDLLALRVGVPTTSRGIRLALVRTQKSRNASGEPASDVRHDDLRAA